MHFLFALLLAFFVVACGDDESSFAPRDDEPTSSSSESVTPKSSGSVRSSSSTPVEDLSSSSAKSSSSVTPKSSSSVRSSSSAEPALSSAEGGEDLSSSSAKSSSSSVSSSSEYVPFDHAKTLGYQKFDEDGYKTFTDPRNGRSYYYITITGTDTVHNVASVTVMAENLNIGDMVLGENDQNDDTKIERYCYNNDTIKCDEFGGLYQWAEMMQLPSRCNTESCAELIQENHQGICPDGWRLFNFNDYVIVINAEGNDDGVKGMRSTYGFSGTNSSGFSLTGAGKRTKKGGFERLKKVAYWFYPQEHEYDERLYVHNGYIAADLADAPQASDGDEKLFGFSVRCVKVE